MSGETVIRAGAVIVGDGSPPLLDHAVRIVDDRIAAVVPASETGDVTVDLPGHTLVPGFVDAHVHLLFDCAVDQETTRARVTDGTPAELALLAAANGLECLRAGVTTVRDLGDRAMVAATLRDAVAAGTLPGPRVLAAGAPITITGGHLWWCGGAVDSPDDLVRRTRELCTSGVDVIKVMASGGNMTRESNKWVPQFTVAELATIVAEARRGGRRVAAHAHSSASIRRCIEAGVDTIEHCGWQSPDGIDLRDEDLTAMKAQGVTATVTMAGIARLFLPEVDLDLADPEARRIAVGLSSSGGDLYGDYHWARRMRDAGIDLVLASDAGVRFTPFSGFLETVRCGIMALGIDAAEAIGMATLNAARALGVDGEVGSIAAGKLADLAVLDRVVTAGSGELGSVAQVWQAGRKVIDDGRLVL